MNQPIGVFDSGIGGLLILKQLLKQFPKRHFLYLADSAHVPYGTKSAETIRSRVSTITNHLALSGANPVIIACNTATVYSDHVDLDVPLHGILAPTAAEAASATKNKNVLVLATNMTAASKAYTKALSVHDITPTEKGCSLFVDLVENGKAGSHEALNKVLTHCAKERHKGYDTIVLGCTHFGALETEIRAAFPHAAIVDGTKGIGEKIAVSQSEEIAENNRSVTLLTTGSLEQFKKHVRTLNIDADMVEHLAL